MLAGNGIDRGRLGRYFAAYAHQCARIVDDNLLSATAGIDRRTGPGIMPLGERLWVAPISTLWT